jgi:hypothetical protein
VSESIFCDNDKHKDGFPIQFKIFTTAFLFWTLLKTIYSWREVNEINESKYDCLIELSVLLLRAIYLLKI